ncbi:hypothetical protein ACI2L1_16105 [Streptomyces sp. NPDC019531]|uniref:hypothetical protein n=1 Tax=Streptomyces sp. NPDC019531 TaxID=3365062 RepID=UPI00384D17A3
MRRVRRGGPGVLGRFSLLLGDRVSWYDHLVREADPPDGRGRRKGSLMRDIGTVKSVRVRHRPVATDERPRRRRRGRT